MIEFPNSKQNNALLKSMTSRFNMNIGELKNKIISFAIKKKKQGVIRFNPDQLKTIKL